MVREDLQSIRRALEVEKAQNSSTFTKRDALHTARRTWMALLVQFGAQALVGVAVVTGYGIVIFETGGWSSETAALLTGAGIFTQAAFGIPGALLSDGIGRPRAMVYGAAACASILALMGMCGFYVNK